MVLSFKKLVIITTNPEFYSIKRFISEGQQYFSEIDVFNPFLSLLDISSLPSTINDADVVIHRITGARIDDHDLVLTDLIQQPKTLIINSLSSLKLHRTKSAQMVFYQKSGISVVPTIFIRNLIKKEELFELLKRYSQKEYILKFERGNQGIGVNYCSNQENLFSWIESLQALKLNTFMIQPFLDRLNEYRIYFCDNEIVATLVRKSTNENSFKVNHHQEGHAELCEKPPRMLLEMAQKIINLSGCFYGSIDIIESRSQKCFLLEVNSVTGFEQFEKVTKIDFVSMIYSRLIKKIN